MAAEKHHSAECMPLISIARSALKKSYYTIYVLILYGDALWIN